MEKPKHQFIQKSTKVEMPINKVNLLGVSASQGAFTRIKMPTCANDLRISDCL